jgi:hypothetical protein
MRSLVTAGVGTKLGRELGLPFGCVPVEVSREVFVEVLGGSLLGEAQGDGSLGEAQGVAMVVPGDALGVMGKALGFVIIGEPMMPVELTIRLGPVGSGSSGAAWGIKGEPRVWPPSSLAIDGLPSRLTLRSDCTSCTVPWRCGAEDGQTVSGTIVPCNPLWRSGGNVCS